VTDASLPDDKVSVSILVPCRNERENIGSLLAEIDASLQGREREIIIVDDGSTDGTHTAVQQAAAGIAGIRLLRHDHSVGQSAALKTALEAATGDVLVTIDGDGQNNPAYIPALIAALLSAAPDTGLAAGTRIGRKASIAKRYGSRVANAVRRRLLHDDTSDTGCGLKAMRRTLFLRLPYFDSWHRYLPALVAREGLRTVHVEVIDRPRRFGASNYGLLDRFWIGILDLFGVWWLRRRRRLAQVHEEQLNSWSFAPGAAESLNERPLTR
jgi:glycosyltransferase involved in cell wall biosynthesis